MAPTIIPQLWLGLCHSTFEVCCSRELDHQNCELGRLAALEGTRCDGDANVTSHSAYATCCRSCQIGLAVKASKVNCKDPLFSFISAIESYRDCCYEDGSPSSASESSSIRSNDTALFAEDDSENKVIPESESESEVETEGEEEGTIVLTGDGKYKL